MKKEIKELYKKDSKLAVAVAKVLGVTIITKEASNSLTDISKVINKSIKDLSKTYSKTYKALGIEIPADIKSKMGNIESIIREFEYLVKENITSQIVKKMMDKATKKGKE